MSDSSMEQVAFVFCSSSDELKPRELEGIFAQHMIYGFLSVGCSLRRRCSSRLW